MPGGSGKKNPPQTGKEGEDENGEKRENDGIRVPISEVGGNRETPAFGKRKLVFKEMTFTGGERPNYGVGKEPAFSK